MSDETVRRLVDALDDAVPREDARLRLEQGPDAVTVVANRTGALRFGLAFLRAAVEDGIPRLEGGTAATAAEAELEALASVAGGSDTWIERVTIVDDFDAYVRADPFPPEARRRRDRIGLVTCSVVFLLFLVVLVTGVVTVVQWLVSHRPG